MIKNELLAAEELDIDFSYPDDYVAFLPHMEEIDNTSWWLIGRSKGFFEICFRLLNVTMGSKKLLVPFAKSDTMNVLACFDESHKVYFHINEDDLADIDWSCVNHLENFSEWLDRVKSGRL